MDILSELETIKADFNAANALLEESKVSQDSLKAVIASKDIELSDASAAIEALKASVDSRDLTINVLQAQLADLKAKQTTAEQKAVEIVAAQGIKPLTVDNSGKGELKTKDEVLAGYSSLKGRAKSLFFEANKEIIFSR